MASNSSPRWTIYSIGFDGIARDILVGALKELKIRTLIDVRCCPNSNKYPQYKLINIKTLLMENDIKYLWKGQQFGGTYKTKQLIEKLNDNKYESASFFLRSTFNLIEYPAVIMCTERYIGDCSRKHIVDALIGYNLANIKQISIDKLNKNKVNCYDYHIDKESTKIKIISNDEKNDEEKNQENLPNDKIIRNTEIKFIEKLPKEMTKSDINGFKSALCIIPPSNIWSSIQEIRKKYDKSYYRWQPHMNILYPFIDEKYFDSQLVHIQNVLYDIKPFKIIFKRFNFFDKGGSTKDPDPNCHLFLQPSPAETIGNLQRIYDALTRLYPFCSSKKHNQGFMGHLTCAQFPKSKCIQYVKTMNTEWKPISFQCQYIYLIARDDDDNPFQIRYKIKLGAQQQTEQTPFL